MPCTWRHAMRLMLSRGGKGGRGLCSSLKKSQNSISMIQQGLPWI